MNRAVKYRYGTFTKVMFGKALLVLIDREPEFYEKYKSSYDDKGEVPDPIPLVKYVIRLYFLFEYGDQKKTLKQLKEINDPYETIIFEKFCGRFAYDYDKKGFVPAYIEIEGTRAMKSIYDKIESPRVAKMWSRAQRYMVDPNRDIPELFYDGEPT